MSHYVIADISKEEEAILKKAEEEIRNKTGKNFIIIAWQEDNDKQ